MNLRTLAAALALAGPLALHPAANDTIRGFDPASQKTETDWEQQARAIPDAARVRTFIEKLSNQPHLAGTPQSKETAEYILAQLREYGLDAHIEQYEALLPTPKSRSLEMTEPTSFKAKLEEPPIAVDKNSSDPGVVPTYNAYSGDGDVTAPLVYVNYGVPADYDTLKQQGIDVKGKIVITRYGGSWRGIKPKVAYEHGAVGCLIYSDPRDDGYFQGDIYPKGAYRPPDGVQRGSVMDMVLYPGDPLSPGWASEPGSKRLALSEATTLMKIPVIPISYADAQPLLANLDGPVAPEAWRGALPITYHIGPGGTKVHLAVTMDNSTHPLYDVIVKIPGSEFPDQWILQGNHHDAWVHGASDPLSGAAPLMETARTYAELTRKGWKPKRTIMMAFWDGEEFGLIGSTEFMEKHADELSQKLVAYVNSDSNGKGRLGIGGSHSLESFSQEVARDIKDPVSGKTLLEEILTRPRRGRGAAATTPDGETPTPPGEFRISPLGSGSDYTPFLQHLGIATLNVGFGGEGGGGVYHSNYDDFYWYSHFSDTTFVYGRTLAQVDATLTMRLADAPVLPFEFGHLSATIGRYLDEIAKLPNQKRPLDLSKVHAEVSQLAKTAAAFDNAYGKAQSKLAGANAEKLTSIDQILYRSERDLTLDPGLPGRPWFRHRIYAPGMYTGYAVKTLPGIREAVEAGNPDEADEQAKQVVQVLHTLNEQIGQASKLLGAL
jgi:N-acetylated-alpha-linked acidic dipeptidase